MLTEEQRFTRDVRETQNHEKQREADRYNGQTQGYAEASKSSRPLLSTADEIELLFTYHPPTIEQAKQYETLRGAAKHLAHVIAANVPMGADRSAAMRKLRECVMTANAAIALDGRV